MHYLPLPNDLELKPHISLFFYYQGVRAIVKNVVKDLHKDSEVFILISTFRQESFHCA